MVYCQSVQPNKFQINSGPLFFITILRNISRVYPHSIEKKFFNTKLLEMSNHYANANGQSYYVGFATIFKKKSKKDIKQKKMKWWWKKEEI